MPTAQKMQVEVKDCLTSVLSRICHDPVPTPVEPLHPCDRRGCEEEAPRETLILRTEIIHRTHMDPRNQEYMGGSLRIEVLEGNDIIVFVDNPGRDRSCSYAAEYAVGHPRFTHLPSCPFLPCSRSLPDSRLELQPHEEGCILKRGIFDEND